VSTQSCSEITAGIASDGRAAFSVCFTASTSYEER
jgi:hypothetical protein